MSTDISGTTADRAVVARVARAKVEKTKGMIWLMGIVVNRPAVSLVKEGRNEWHPEKKKKMLWIEGGEKGGMKEVDGERIWDVKYINHYLQKCKSL